MKLWFLLVALILAGCSSHIYGVPEEAWNALSPEQKTATIRGYNERQLLEQQARVHREEQWAAQARVEAELALDRARRQAEQVEAIYRNEAGQYGDLIRVSVSGGTMHIAGKPRAYQGLSFKIADGESKEIPVWSEERKNSRQGVLLVSYLDGVLLVDSSPRQSRDAARLIYDPAWKAGRTYLQVHSSGPMGLQGAQIAIEIIPLRR